MDDPRGDHEVVQGMLKRLGLDMAVPHETSDRIDRVVRAKAEDAGVSFEEMRDALAGKAYYDGLDASPELVIAFIPSEPVLAALANAPVPLVWSL